MWDRDYPLHNEDMTMNMQATTDQIARVTTDWSTIAGELLTVQITNINDPIYAFGSELACLRLEHKMHVGHAAYSSNMGMWYYANK